MRKNVTDGNEGRTEAVREDGGRDRERRGGHQTIAWPPSQAERVADRGGEDGGEGDLVEQEAENQETSWRR